MDSPFTKPKKSPSLHCLQFFALGAAGAAQSRQRYGGLERRSEVLRRPPRLRPGSPAPYRRARAKTKSTSAPARIASGQTDYDRRSTSQIDQMAELSAAMPLGAGRGGGARTPLPSGEGQGVREADVSDKGQPQFLRESAPAQRQDRRTPRGS